MVYLLVMKSLCYAETYHARTSYQMFFPFFFYSLQILSILIVYEIGACFMLINSCRTSLELVTLCWTPESH